MSDVFVIPAQPGTTVEVIQQGGKATLPVIAWLIQPFEDVLMDAEVTPVGIGGAIRNVRRVTIGELTV